MSSEPAEIADQLHGAAIRLLRRLRRTDTEAGLTGPQASVLSVLVFGGGLGLGRLAAVEQVSAPTMSRLVSDLEAIGLVARQSDPADRRGVRVVVTEQGRARLEQGRARRLGRLQAAVDALPPSEQALLLTAARLLARIADSPELD